MQSTAALMPLFESLIAVRDRLLASASFQRWAAAFPLTRPIARRRARALFDIVAGFVYSQVLLACVELRLFDILSEGAQTAGELARRLSLPLDGVEKLLGAALALQLVTRRGKDRFGLGPLGAPMVGNSGIAAMVEHHRSLYADLRDPVALLRNGAAGADTELSRYWPYAAAAAPDALPDAQVAPYTALMSASQPMVASEVLNAYPLGAHRCLLDVGGGEGTFVIAAAARNPRLQVMVFDLPAVRALASDRLAKAGLGARAKAYGGSFFSDPLPTGADIISLVRVIFDHDDAHALTILRAARAALPEGGTLLLAEPMSDVPGAETMGGAYFGFYLLAMGRGRSRTPAQLEKLMADAGFRQIRRISTRMPLNTGLLIAKA